MCFHSDKIPWNGHKKSREIKTKYNEKGTKMNKIEDV
jgi:hypothetical protein